MKIERRPLTGWVRTTGCRTSGATLKQTILAKFFCPSLPCELFLVPLPLKDLTIMHLQIDIFNARHGYILLSSISLDRILWCGFLYTVHPFQAGEHFLHPD